MVRSFHRPLDLLCPHEQRLIVQLLVVILEVLLANGMPEGHEQPIRRHARIDLDPHRLPVLDQIQHLADMRIDLVLGPYRQDGLVYHVELLDQPWDEVFIDRLPCACFLSPCAHHILLLYARGALLPLAYHLCQRLFNGGIATHSVTSCTPWM